MSLYPKGKTEYNLSIFDKQRAEQTVQEWLRANEFERKEENGTIYYICHDSMTGNRLFEYEIEDNQIKILAYLGKFDKPRALEGAVGMIYVDAYRDVLGTLFQALDKQERKNEMQPNNENNQIEQNDNNMQMNQPVVNSTVDYDNFKQEADKKKEKMAEISFWISILMLIAAFVGVSLSVLIAILNYYFAAQGLKSKKRGKAIAAIVMTSVSIVVIIIMVALTLAE